MVDCYDIKKLEASNDWTVMFVDGKLGGLVRVLRVTANKAGIGDADVI